MPKSTLNQFREPPSIKHLKRLTTSDGIIQHARQEVPDQQFGYSIDDNARALIVCLWHFQLFHDHSILTLANIYLQYLERAATATGSFHNFVSISGDMLDDEGSADSISRAIWALGEVIRCAPDDALTVRAQALLGSTALKHHATQPHVHTTAYMTLGLLAAGNHKAAISCANRLSDAFDKNRHPDWLWFDNELTYANGIFPYALAKAASGLHDDHFGTLAQRSFEWLNEVSHEQTTPCPIGQAGWYVRGRAKAHYDQQPLEGADMVLAASELYRLTNQEKYLASTLEWHDWYLGNNLQHRSMINQQTGGIYDGLTPTGINQNQGAESIVTYLMAYLSLSLLAMR